MSKWFFQVFQKKKILEVYYVNNLDRKLNILHQLIKNQFFSSTPTQDINNRQFRGCTAKKWGVTCLNAPIFKKNFRCFSSLILQSQITRVH